MSGGFTLGLLFGSHFSFLRSLLLHLGRTFTVDRFRHLAESTHGARGNTNAAAVDTDGLEVEQLAAAGRDVRVGTGVHALGAFAGEDINAGHMFFGMGLRIHEECHLGKP